MAYPDLAPGDAGGTGDLAYRFTSAGPTDSTAGASAKLWLR
jgi:hypothetical protein